jgi:hypothetical protein
MNDALNTPLPDASWPTSIDGDQGKAATLAQEIASIPQISRGLTSTVPQCALEDFLGDDDDVPCGEPGRPFSFDPGHVTSWLHRFYGSHERLRALLVVAPEMEIGELLIVLGEEWTGLDYIAFDSAELFYVLVEREVDYESPIIQMMSSEEWAAFHAQPDEITIYRGCGPRNRFGYSWTLDRKVAEKFPFMGGITPNIRLS